jgi:hypothetical protein
LLGRGQTGGEAEVTLRDRGPDIARFPNGSVEARESLRACRLIGIADDEAQAFVAKVYQVLRHLIGRAAIVYSNTNCVLHGMRAYRGHRQSRLTEQLQHGRRFAQRRRHNEAPNSGCREQLQLGLGRGLAALAFQENQAHPARGGLLEYANQEVTHECSAGIGINHADLGLGRGHETAGSNVGCVAQHAYGVLDNGAGIGANPAFSVDHA